MAKSGRRPRSSCKEKGKVFEADRPSSKYAVYYCMIHIAQRELSIKVM